MLSDRKAERFENTLAFWGARIAKLELTEFKERK